MLSLILNPSDKLWHEIVNSLRVDFYHYPKYNLLESLRMNGKPEAFIFQEGEKIFFVPYILRKIGNTNLYDVSSAYGYPQPIFSNAAVEDTDFCQASVERWFYLMSKKNVVSIFIRFHPLIKTKYSFWKGLGTLVKHGNTVYLDLNSEKKQIWQQTRKRFRSNVNRLKKNPTLSIVSSWDYYLDFIDMYKSNMDEFKAGKEYYFSEQYFFTLRDILSDAISLYSVTKNGEPICAALFTECNGIVQYHLGCTNLKHKKESPSKLLFYHVTQKFKTNGNTFFHLGGGVGASNDTLYHFKSGFSKLRASYYTLRIIINPKQYVNLCKDRPNTFVNDDVIDAEKYFPLYRK